MTDNYPKGRDLVPTRRVASLASGVLLVLVIAACGPEPKAPELAGSDEFLRILQADHWFDVRVTGVADSDWVVSEATLASPLFTSMDSRAMMVRLFADGPAHVKGPLGEAMCDAHSGPTVATLTMSHYGIGTAPDAPGEVSVTLTGLRGSVIFDLEPAGALPVSLEAGAEQVFSE